jgi:hypothetical protein
MKIPRHESILLVLIRDDIHLYRCGNLYATDRESPGRKADYGITLGLSYSDRMKKVSIARISVEIDKDPTLRIKAQEQAQEQAQNQAQDRF